MSIQSIREHGTSDGTTMYDTRIPDAIDNALFVLLSLGFLAAEATAIVLVALVGGVQALATLFLVGISGVAGAFALARGKRV